MNLYLSTKRPTTEMDAFTHIQAELFPPPPSGLVCTPSHAYIQPDRDVMDYFGLHSQITIFQKDLIAVAFWGHFKTSHHLQEWFSTVTAHHNYLGYFQNTLMPTASPRPVKSESLGAGPWASEFLKSFPSNSNVQSQLRNTNIHDVPLYGLALLAEKIMYCF